MTFEKPICNSSQNSFLNSLLSYYFHSSELLFVLSEKKEQTELAQSNLEMPHSLLIKESRNEEVFKLLKLKLIFCYIFYLEVSKIKINKNNWDNWE